MEDTTANEPVDPVAEFINDFQKDRRALKDFYRARALEVCSTENYSLVRCQIDNYLGACKEEQECFDKCYNPFMEEYKNIVRNVYKFRVEARKKQEQGENNKTEKSSGNVS